MKNHHRRSALETFDGCPYRFDILYNTCQTCGHRHRDTPDACSGDGNQGCMCTEFKQIEDRGDEAHRGIGFHEVAFRYIDRLAKAKVKSDAEEASLAFREGVAISQVPVHLVHQVKRLWQPFVEHFQLDLNAYFEAEKQQVSAFCLNCTWRGGDQDVQMADGLPECPECGGPLSGFTWIPDLVYIRPSEVEITDWKTYYKGLTDAQARTEFQTKFYLWNAKNLWPGFARYRFTFNFVRLRYSVSVVLTEDEIDAFSDEVKGIMLGIHEANRTKNYPAIPGSHCNLCRLKCPVADNRFRLPVRITSHEERDAVAGKLLATEQEMKALKKTLKAYCDINGPFEMNGQVFGHFPNVQERFPAWDTLKFMDQRGVDLTKITLSREALKDEGHPKKGKLAVLEQLTKTAIRKMGWTFRHRKAGEDLPEDLADLLADTEGQDDADR